VEQIDRLEALATDLASKFKPPGADACPGRSGITWAVRYRSVGNWFGVPAEEEVAAIGVDAAEHAVALAYASSWPMCGFASVAWLVSTLNLNSLSRSRSPRRNAASWRNRKS